MTWIIYGFERFIRTTHIQTYIHTYIHTRHLHSPSHNSSGKLLLGQKIIISMPSPYLLVYIYIYISLSFVWSKKEWLDVDILFLAPPLVMYSWGDGLLLKLQIKVKNSLNLKYCSKVEAQCFLFFFFSKSNQVISLVFVRSNCSTI